MYLKVVIYHIFNELNYRYLREVWWVDQQVSWQALSCVSADTDQHNPCHLYDRDKLECDCRLHSKQLYHNLAADCSHATQFNVGNDD